jgi:hypothetical protein
MMRVFKFLRYWTFVYCMLWCVADFSITAYYDVYLSPWTLAAIIWALITFPKDTTP